MTSELRVRKLDLAARALDLTLALVHATSSSDKIIRGAWEIGQWLGRERLNQYELQDCMLKAKGLVLPNENALELFDGIIEGMENKRVGPLFLQQSGSLGRLLAGDPNLSWLVSTIACLFQFHRDEQFVSNAVTAFILFSEEAQHKAGSGGMGDSLFRKPVQTQIRPVLNKIVTSVWYNVINAGCDTILLPPELLAVCPKKHYLDVEDFARVTYTLYAHCTTKAILRLQHLLADVILWLLLHYDGHLIVNVGGEIVYEKHFGNQGKELEVYVKARCPQSEPCKVAFMQKYEILQDIGGHFESVLKLHSCQDPYHPQPGIRQSLYGTLQRHSRESNICAPDIQKTIKITAQSMMRWILDIFVLPQEGFSDLGFSVVLDSKRPKKAQYKISDVLKRVPSILNLNWGTSHGLSMIYEGDNTRQGYEGGSQSSINGDWSEKLKTSDRLIAIHALFPILQQLLWKVRGSCLCPRCQTSEDETLRLQPGCLQ
jgi:hypothetical protein